MIRDWRGFPILAVSGAYDLKPACRVVMFFVLAVLAGCAQAPADSDPIRADQDPWERVGTTIAKKQSVAR